MRGRVLLVIAASALLADMSVGDQLYWANEQGSAIIRANRDGSGASPVLPFLNHPWDLVIDESTAKIYWTESIGDRIASANIDGTAAATILTIDDPESLAIDFINGKLIWGGIGLRRANLDGSNVEVIGAAGEVVTSVAIDVVNQFVYYADHFADRIVRQPLAGGPPQLFLSGLTDHPSAIAVDVQSNLIYWTDSSRLWKANLLDGSNRTVLYPNIEYSRDIFLDPSRARIWWTWEDGEVGSAPTAGISSAPINGGGPITTFGVAFRPVGLWLAKSLPLGDYNRNLVIDAADYVVWRDQLGQLVPACSGADANCDGFVAVGDYQPWKENFGRTLVSSTNSVGSGHSDRAANVPESASSLLFLLGANGIVLFRRAPKFG